MRRFVKRAIKGFTFTAKSILLLRSRQSLLLRRMYTGQVCRAADITIAANGLQARLTQSTTLFTPTTDSMFVSRVSLRPQVPNKTLRIGKRLLLRQARRKTRLKSVDKTTERKFKRLLMARKRWKWRSMKLRWPRKKLTACWKLVRKELSPKRYRKRRERWKAETCRQRAGHRLFCHYGKVILKRENTVEKVLFYRLTVLISIN